MISFEHVSKFILSDVSLHIPEGVIVGVIGASGAGKTTMLRLICGLLKCEQGSVRTFFMDPVKKRRQIAPDIRAFFSDAPVFPEDSTILCEFQRLSLLYGMGRQEFRENYEMLADKLHFKEYEEVPVRQLSLGQRRRAELGTVLLGECRLILLDEPTNGLDEPGKESFWECLRRKRESGTTVAIASHNMTEAEGLCDRIILLEGGRLLYYGERDRLMRRYAPIHEMMLEFQGKIPDIEDLPLLRYSLENNTLRLQYDSNLISAAEIARHLMEQTAIIRMKIIKPELEDVIMNRLSES